MTHPAIEKVRKALEESRDAFHDPDAPESEQCAGYRMCVEALRALDEAMKGAEPLELVTASHRGLRRFLCLPLSEEAR